MHHVTSRCPNVDSERPARFDWVPPAVCACEGSLGSRSPLLPNPALDPLRCLALAASLPSFRPLALGSRRAVPSSQLAAPAGPRSIFLLAFTRPHTAAVAARAEQTLLSFFAELRYKDSCHSRGPHAAAAAAAVAASGCRPPAPVGRPPPPASRPSAPHLTVGLHGGGGRRSGGRSIHSECTSGRCIPEAGQRAHAVPPLQACPTL